MSRDRGAIRYQRVNFDMDDDDDDEDEDDKRMLARALGRSSPRSSGRKCIRGCLIASLVLTAACAAAVSALVLTGNVPDYAIVRFLHFGGGNSTGSINTTETASSNSSSSEDSNNNSTLLSTDPLNLPFDGDALEDEEEDELEADILIDLEELEAEASSAKPAQDSKSSKYPADASGRHSADESAARKTTIPLAELPADEEIAPGQSRPKVGVRQLDQAAEEEEAHAEMQIMTESTHVDTRWLGLQQWDVIALAVILIVMVLSLGVSFVCLCRLVRSRRLSQRRHFSRLVRDLSSTDKFTIVNDEDDNGQESVADHDDHEVVVHGPRGASSN